MVFRRKRRKNFRRIRGHRQDLTLLQITDIAPDGKLKAAKPAEAKKPAVEKPAAKPAEAKKPAADKPAAKKAPAKATEAKKPAAKKAPAKKASTSKSKDA
jgi:hypothetical protein